MVHVVLQLSLCFVHEAIPDLEAALVSCGRAECGQSTCAEKCAPGIRGLLRV